MPGLKSLPAALRVLILVVVFIALLLLIITNTPAIVTTTSERFFGFLEGGGSQEPTTEATITTKDEYLSIVEELQTSSEENFRDTEARFSRFDSLTPDDVERMKTNSSDLRSYFDQAEALHPPEEYKDHYELFRTAVADLNQAAELAYSSASNPSSLRKADLDQYRRYRANGISGLQQANEVLSQKSNFTDSSITTIEDVTVAELFGRSKERYINVHAEAKSGEAHPPGIACADLTPTASDAGAQEKSREVDLSPSRNSGVSGTAAFEDTKDGVEARLNVEGLPEGGAEHFVHIHEGASCQDDRDGQGGEIEFPLNSIEVEGSSS